MEPEGSLQHSQVPYIFLKIKKNMLMRRLLSSIHVLNAFSIHFTAEFLEYEMFTLLALVPDLAL